eukprot:589994_1
MGNSATQLEGATNTRDDVFSSYITHLKTHEITIPEWYDSGAPTEKWALLFKTFKYRVRSANAETEALVLRDSDWHRSIGESRTPNGEEQNDVEEYLFSVLANHAHPLGDLIRRFSRLFRASFRAQRLGRGNSDSARARPHGDKAGRGRSAKRQANKDSTKSVKNANPTAHNSKVERSVSDPLHRCTRARSSSRLTKVHARMREVLSDFSTRLISLITMLFPRLSGFVLKEACTTAIQRALFAECGSTVIRLYAVLNERDERVFRKRVRALNKSRVRVDQFGVSPRLSLRVHSKSTGECAEFGESGTSSDVSANLRPTSISSTSSELARALKLRRDPGIESPRGDPGIESPRRDPGIESPNQTSEADSGTNTRHTSDVCGEKLKKSDAHQTNSRTFQTVDHPMKSQTRFAPEKHISEKNLSNTRKLKFQSELEDLHNQWKALKSQTCDKSCGSPSSTSLPPNTVVSSCNLSVTANGGLHMLDNRLAEDKFNHAPPLTKVPLNHASGRRGDKSQSLPDQRVHSASLSTSRDRIALLESIFFCKEFESRSRKLALSLQLASHEEKPLSKTKTRGFRRGRGDSGPSSEPISLSHTHTDQPELIFAAPITPTVKEPLSACLPESNSATVNHAPHSDTKRINHANCQSHKSYEGHSVDNSHCEEECDPYVEAIQEFRQIVTEPSPIGKLRVLQSVAEVVCACVDEFRGNSEEEGVPPAQICADDLLSIFCYIVTRADVPLLVAQTHFMEDFIPTTMQAGQAGYYLATLRAAVTLLPSLELQSCTK